MTQDQIIERIKELKWELQHHFDDAKLIRLYYLIDQLKAKGD